MARAVPNFETHTPTKKDLVISLKNFLQYIRAFSSYIGHFFR